MLIDLSHTIRDGLITYPGLPSPKVSAFWSRPEKKFHIAKIEMVANTGTYLDSPYHRHEEGLDLSGLALERLANLDGIVFELGGALPDVRNKAVIVRTGWSRHFEKEEYGSGRHPFVDRRLAQKLADEGAALVGIDSFNIDDTGDASRPAHTILLGAGIPIVEHLTGLDRLPASEFRFFAVPPKFAGVGTFPVRAFALV
jgi:arylformamidase